MTTVHPKHKRCSQLDKFCLACHKLTTSFFLQLSGFTPNARVLYPRHKQLLLIKEMLNIKQNLKLLFKVSPHVLWTHAKTVSIPNFTKRPSKTVTREATLAHAKTLLLFYDVRRTQSHEPVQAWTSSCSLARLQVTRKYDLLNASIMILLLNCIQGELRLT